jgi:hypothetical protein
MSDEIKKRGRKPKNIDNINNDNNNEQKVPKKRGRKPKVKVETNEVKIPKKRGRKPKKTLTSNSNKLMDLANITQHTDKNIILHLPIKIDDIKSEMSDTTAKCKTKNNSDTDDDSDVYDDYVDDDISDNENDEDNVDNNEDIFTTKDSSNNKSNDENIFINNNSDNIFGDNISDSDSDSDKCKTCTKYENIIANLKKRIDTLEKSRGYMKDRTVYRMNIKFSSIDNGKNIWSEQTDIHCWWCCHQFDTIPCLLPDKYYKNTYYGFGCFCSYNCALAYNIDLNDYKVWERCTLLKSLVSQLYDTENHELLPAPPRQVLKIFGGKLNIEEFRENSKIMIKEFKYLMPPLVSIIPLIEEDYKDKKFIKSENNVINHEDDKSHLKLKRTKPLAHNKNSLETSMGIITRKKK